MLVGVDFSDFWSCNGFMVFGLGFRVFGLFVFLLIDLICVCMFVVGG